MQHAEAETLAAFVDGNLDGEELDRVSSHLQECEECRGVIGEAALFEQEEEPKPRARWWLPVAAGVAVAVIAAAPFVRHQWRERDIAQKKQALYESIPIAERMAGRLADQNVWRAHKNDRGQPGDDQDDDRALAELRRDSAAAELIEAAGKDTSPEALRAKAAGLAYSGNAGEALKTLLEIPQTERDAATWNDIAVLLQQTAQPGALAAVAEALKRQPNMPEALFTRASILYETSSPQAIAAYEEYLKVDRQSPWADEARSKINFLKEFQ